MRNVKKQIEQGHAIISDHPNMDLLAKELQQFKDTFDENLLQKGVPNAVYHIIIDAFHFGVAVGYRTRKRESTK